MSRFFATYHGAGVPTTPAVIEQVDATFGASAVSEPGASLCPATQVSNSRPIWPAETAGYPIIEAPGAEAAAEIPKPHPFTVRGGTHRWTKHGRSS